MRVNLAIDVAHVTRACQRHVAIGALRRLGRIIKRPLTLSRYAAGLPVVVLVKSANPTIVIDRNVEMNFVAARAKFRRLVAHERLEKHAAVGLRIKFYQKIVQQSLKRIFGRGQFVQLGIFEIKVTLPHAALHVGNRMAHHATQPGLRLWAVNDLLDRRIHQAAVKHRGIVASAAPLRRLGANRVLHILDALAVPLIVERREMMGRTEPLIVDVLVASFAGIGFHEELAGNFLSAVDLSGTKKEGPIWSVALAIHAGGWHRGILNTSLILPARLPHITRARAYTDEH